MIGDEMKFALKIYKKKINNRRIKKLQDEDGSV
jgi:hypothetical protein